MAIKIEAASRLAVTAAEGSEEAGQQLLKSLGFKGLTLKKSAEDLLVFYYKSYDEDKLEKKLGSPKDTKGSSIRYNYGKAGVIAVWPDEEKVVLRNSHRSI